jgi:hypothetical protein
MPRRKARTESRIQKAEVRMAGRRVQIRSHLTFSIVVGIGMVLASAARAEESVHFNDPNLKAAVE